MARILMVTPEAAPFVKTGGLADVLGSLPPALAAAGEQVAVVLPRYRSVSIEGARKILDPMPLWIGPYRYSATLWMIERAGVAYYLVDSPDFYDRDGIYAGPWGDHWDNDTRFAALCHAGLAVARRIFRPDIIHCHDWQTGLLPVYLNQYYHSDPTFQDVKTVFTIHNMGYQGSFGRERLAWLGLPDAMFRPDLMEFYGRINLLKAGIVFSDYITTVSPKYAREIQTAEQGFGLDGLMRARSGFLEGILNGVDYSVWNPETDPNIAANYTAADLSAKLQCKLDLLRVFGLADDRPEVPVVGIVSRLAGQKGFDLIAQVADDLVHWDIRIVVLGTGEAKYEEMFRRLAASRPDRFAIHVGFDPKLAHKVEAGSDIFLMPSHYEPCGLNQMYSLRYGTVPVVHATGGLDDTIDADTGFKFSPYSADAMLGALRAALTVYWVDRERWLRMMRTGMSRDFSWETAAVAYSDLSHRLAG